MNLDESAIADQVIATHDPNQGKDLSANFVLNFAENILNMNKDSPEIEKDMLALLQEPELQHQLIQLSSEVKLKSLSDSDSHSTAIYLLSILSTYSWETKAVMMLAAFAIIYGKVITISRQCHQKNLANKLLALLNKSNLIVEPSYINIEKFVDSFIKFTIDLVKCVVELNPPSFSSLPQPVILASYWIARSILAYAQHIFYFESQNKVMEGSILIAKTKSILTTCHPLLEERRTEKSYQALLDAFSNSSNILEVLKLIFNVDSDDNTEVFRHAAGFNYGVNRVEKERLLLIIMSDTNISEFDFLSNQLRDIGVETRIIWIPIIDDLELWTTQNMQSRLIAIHRYGSIVLDPHKRITPHFIKFVKKKCFPAFQSCGEPIVLSLDNHGRLVHYNALQMILTWRHDLERETNIVDSGKNIVHILKKELTKMTLGVDPVIHNIKRRISDLVDDIEKKIDAWRHDINAEIEDSGSSYNYTSKKEKELWDKEIWNLKLLVRIVIGGTFRIDDTITNWIEKKHDIFLYGGDDAKCLEQFLSKVNEVESKTRLNIKLAYIGQSKKVKSMVEKVSDYALISSDEYWWFWTRLRSMFLSRINYLNKIELDEGGDKIVRELQKLLAYEAKGTSVGGWALLSKGEEIIACDSGDKMLKVMNEYHKWSGNVHNKGFSQAFKDCYDMLASSRDQDHHCYCTLEYPCTLEKIPKDVECPQCSHNMHKFVTFTCCHDQYIWN